MSEYTPTTEDVREAYKGTLIQTGEHTFELIDEERAEKEFDRWLAQVKAEAWDEGTLWAAGISNAPDNPYR